jgi:MYXO-CTERM domain-containing protein
VTDSPWFWLGLFGLAAFLALVAIGPKFQRRHARLELQSQAREQIWRDRVEQATHETNDLASRPAVSVEPQPRDGRWLWPLGGLALLVTTICWGRLWWQQRLVSPGPPADQADRDSIAARKTTA